MSTDQNSAIQWYNFRTVSCCPPEPKLVFSERLRKRMTDEAFLTNLAAEEWKTETRREWKSTKPWHSRELSNVSKSEIEYFNSFSSGFCYTSCWYFSLRKKSLLFSPFPSLSLSFLSSPKLNMQKRKNCLINGMDLTDDEEKHQRLPLLLHAFSPAFLVAGSKHGPLYVSFRVEQSFFGLFFCSFRIDTSPLRNEWSNGGEKHKNLPSSDLYLLGVSVGDLSNQIDT